jgi:hypothetical protein
LKYGNENLNLLNEFSSSNHPDPESDLNDRLDSGKDEVQNQLDNSFSAIQRKIKEKYGLGDSSPFA